jgi:hydrogenase maturation protein HypF
LHPGTTKAKLQPAIPLEEARTVPLQIDCRSLIEAVARDARGGVTASLIGRRFHSTLVEIIAHVCRRLQKENGLNRVVLSGGVFMNALLLQETVARLAETGFEVYRHRRVPPNDGGLCLGQLAIAAAKMKSAWGGVDVSRHSR